MGLQLCPNSQGSSAFQKSPWWRRETQPPWFQRDPAGTMFVVRTAPGRRLAGHVVLYRETVAVNPAPLPQTSAPYLCMERWHLRSMPTEP